MSSSEDENIGNLQECIDPSFFPCSIKTDNAQDALPRVSKESEGPKKPQCRELGKHESIKARNHAFEFASKEDNLPFGLPRLEPGAQNMLSKALQKKLDKDLEYDASGPTPQSSTHSVLGIRLFRQSEDFVQSTSNVVKEPIVQTKPNLLKTRKRMLESDPEEKLDFTSIVVSPEWVLEKRGVYGNGREKRGELITGAIHSPLLKRSKL